MPFPRLTAAFILSGACLAGSAACGDSTAENRNYGTPPDPSAFNPGDGTSGGAYGYGNGSGSTTPVCPAELERCPQTFTLADANYTSVELRGDWDGQATWDKGVAMTKSGSTWTVAVPIPLATAVQYRFFINGSSDGYTDPTQPTKADPSGTSNNLFNPITKCAVATTCSEEGQLPPGVFDWRDSTIYFVFVDRFNNGNTALDAACHVANVSGAATDYQGGDWAGVTAKINDGYFTDLGVNTLWVTVPIQNPGDAWAGTGGDNHNYSGYHGYWPNPGADAAADPTKVTAENCFGTMDDLKGLVSAAHKKGLKILFDYAMVHVHTESPLYKAHVPNQGQADGWFWPGVQQSGQDCICGQGCSWDTQYKQCWFAPYLAHWNYTNNDARAWSVANAVAWVKGTQDTDGNGADGFRCDAIKHVETSWMNDVRTKINSDVLATQNPKQRFYMVGETYDFGNRDFIKSFINPTTGLDGQFDFPLRAQIIQALLMRTENMSDLANFMDGNDYFYGADAIMSPFLGNHDLPRIIHLAQNTPLWGDQGRDGKDRNFQNQPGLVGETEAYERVANGFALMYTNRGAPLLYYGDEYGQPGAGDPDNRRFMQWSGYNANQTYLHDRIKTLLQIRAKHPAFRRGTRTTLGSNADTWVYSRVTTGDTVYVAINRSDSPQQVGNLPSGTLNEEVTGTTVSGGTVTIPPRQTRIFTQ